MGTIGALSYANVFIYHIEKTYTFPSRTFINLLLIYLRFIDDIFFIWACNKEQLTNYLINLNKKQSHQV